MILSVKKFIYVLNDITNLLLKKDRADDKGKIKNLRVALIVVLTLLAVSLVFNIYLLIK